LIFECVVFFTLALAITTAPVTLLYRGYNDVLMALIGGPIVRHASQHAGTRRGQAPGPGGQARLTRLKGAGYSGPACNLIVTIADIRISSPSQSLQGILQVIRHWE
jgi:hypothetical protein